jgi:serine/threonine protein kinase
MRLLLLCPRFLNRRRRSTRYNSLTAPSVALAPGTRIGVYEILSPLGAGGMGEVYRARDIKLKRDVALKVLSDAFSSDPERMARFQREAEVLASLNHPHIAHLYGLEERTLVMELVEGESLPCPLSLETALNYAKQIAEALEYAHERGVVHRDLKPANIKITPDGVVKVLDFGLAKAIDDPIPSADLSNSPTLTLGATRVGVILGTAAYMSPEQASGHPADRRADIWSFGAVLYEMLAGTRAFGGDSVPDTLATVLKLEPDWNALPTRTPASIRTLVRRCLTKDRKQRLQAIGEARIALEHPERQEADITPAPAPSTSRLTWVLAAASAVLFAVAAALAVVHFRETPLPAQTVRSSITLPENSTVHSFAVSPDGRSLVIAAEVAGKRQLWLRALDALQAQVMPFTEGASYPFWSPDSRFIGFFAQGKLNKVPASGGPAQPLCDSISGDGGSWNRDDVIVFSPGLGTSIQRVAAAGGTPVDVTRTKRGLWPVFLPDGRHFLYFGAGSTADQTGIYVSSLDGTENRRVLADESGIVFAPLVRGDGRGHVLFVRDSTLMAVAFETGSAQVSGEVFPVAEDVSLTVTDGYLPATVSENGVLLYARAGGEINQMGWYNRSGTSFDPVGPPGVVHCPSLSPNEKSVVFMRVARTLTRSAGDLWVRDLSRGSETPLTSDSTIHTTNCAPFWSPEGGRIVFTSNGEGVRVNLYQRAANGIGPVEPLLPNSLNDIPSQWSRDGRFIVYTEFDPKTKWDLWVLPTEGGAADRKPVAFLRSESNELFGQLSPDSHWMAFTSDKSGRREVYVRPFRAGEGEWLISGAGGQAPRWRADGKELFFEAANGKMMAVPVTARAGATASFELGAPMSLFDAHIVHSTSFTDVFEYDVTADGKRFLINTTSRQGVVSGQALTVVVNWLAGAKK